jgi:hypothetical protein
MHDTGKIIIGLAVFLIAVTFPFWFSLANETSGYRPELQLPKDETDCVETTEYMRALHMDLLDDWRDQVVREGQRVYISSSGKRHNMSLTGNCLGCHTSKADFCDQCHNYVGISPYCWDCHIDTTPQNREGN